jgi:nicotinate-nucleotide adenylyltransferase
MGQGVRIGVFGGAFDPPHLGHQQLANCAVAQLQLDQLRIVPTGHAWHKPRDLTPAAHRIAMTRLAFADVPGVVVDERECHRIGPSYTVDTLLQLCAENPGAALYLIIGADQARALPQWRAWQTVLQIAIICVAVRDIDRAETLELAHAQAVQSHSLVAPELTGLGQFQILSMPPMAVSATQIRSRVANGLTITDLLSPPVASYIAQHHLYR